jgi:MFS family permease
VLWLAIPRCVKGTLDAAPYLQFPGIIQDCCNNIIPASGAIAGPILLSLMTTLLLAFAAMSCLALVGGASWLGWVLGFDCGLLLIGSQPGLNALFASSYPTSIRSTGIGWAGGIGRLTSMVGPAIGALILTAGWELWEIYPAIAARLLLGAAAMLVFYLRRARETGLRSGMGERLCRLGRTCAPLNHVIRHASRRVAHSRSRPLAWPRLDEGLASAGAERGTIRCLRFPPQNIGSGRTGHSSC